MPEVAFRVQGTIGAFEAVANIPTRSFRSASVASILQQIASETNMTFTNNGVTTVISNVYLYGSARNQALKAAKAANINLDFSPPNMTIWPKGGARSSTVTQINPMTGLVGYPGFESKGIVVTTLFNPTLDYGSQIQVNTQIGGASGVSSVNPVQAANGMWRVYALDHDLESMVPNGKWFSALKAAPLAYFDNFALTQ